MDLDKYKLVFKHYDQGYDSREEWYYDVYTYECPLTDLKVGQPVPFKKQGCVYDVFYEAKAYWDPKFVCKTVNIEGVLIEISGNNHSFKSEEDKWEYEHSINGKSRDTYNVTLEKI